MKWIWLFNYQKWRNTEKIIIVGRVLDNKFIIENKVTVTGSESQNEVISNVFIIMKILMHKC